jgi:hypothetical protein
MTRWLPLVLVFALPAHAAVPECLPAQPLDVVLQIGESGLPQRLQLVGGASPPLRLQQPDSGAVFWSAAASGPATQVFPSLWAGFSGSLAVVDLDGDGLHDRLYAGDLAGRLWRFDIHNGLPAESLLTGGIFAALGGVPALRAFVIPPDLSLSGNPEGTSTLNIAIGTVSLMPGAASNRFFVLRDVAPHSAWSQREYDLWRPIQESDLTWVNDPQASSAEPAHLGEAGFYVTLAGTSMVLRSITVSGRAVIAMALQPASGVNCSVSVTVGSVSIEDGRAAVDFDGDGAVRSHETLRLPQLLPASSDFSLSASPEGSEAICRLGDTPLAACSLSTRLVPTWWRREDAD